MEKKKRMILKRVICENCANFRKMFSWSDGDELVGCLVEASYTTRIVPYMKKRKFFHLQVPKNCLYYAEYCISQWNKK